MFFGNFQPADIYRIHKIRRQLFNKLPEKKVIQKKSFKMRWNEKI